MQAFETVDQAASDAIAMLADGERLSRLWRYVFVQMLDDYTSVLRHAGVPAAARMWASPPRSTGDIRVDAAFAATTRSQLSALTRDLPPVATPSAPLPVSAADGRRERAGREHRPGSRARLGLIPMIIAAVIAWLLIVDLQLRMFPWPGKLAIFLLIFTTVRGLMRRIWHLGRGGGGRMGCGRYWGGR